MFLSNSNKKKKKKKTHTLFEVILFSKVPLSIIKICKSIWRKVSPKTMVLKTGLDRLVRLVKLKTNH